MCEFWYVERDGDYMRFCVTLQTHRVISYYCKWKVFLSITQTSQLSYTPGQMSHSGQCPRCTGQHPRTLGSSVEQQGLHQGPDGMLYITIHIVYCWLLYVYSIVHFYRSASFRAVYRIVYFTVRTPAERQILQLETKMKNSLMKCFKTKVDLWEERYDSTLYEDYLLNRQIWGNSGLITWVHF